MRNQINFLRIAEFFIYPATLFVFSYLLLYLGVYDLFPWIDAPIHFLGGVAAGYTFLLTINYFEEKGFIKLNKTSKTIFVVSLVALIAVLWEMYEFLLVQITGLSYLQGDLADTMKDLMIGLLGGGFLGAVFMKDSLH